MRSDPCAHRVHDQRVRLPDRGRQPPESVRRVPARAQPHGLDRQDQRQRLQQRLLVRRFGRVPGWPVRQRRPGRVQPLDATVRRGQRLMYHHQHRVPGQHGADHRAQPGFGRRRAGQRPDHFCPGREPGHCGQLPGRRLQPEQRHRARPGAVRRGRQRLCAVVVTPDGCLFLVVAGRRTLRVPLRHRFFDRRLSRSAAVLHRHVRRGQRDGGIPGGGDRVGHPAG